jgi:hypothetical protein
VLGAARVKGYFLASQNRYYYVERRSSHLSGVCCLVHRYYGGKLSLPPYQVATPSVLQLHPIFQGSVVLEIGTATDNYLLLEAGQVAS